jgi:hypothetical protein
MRMARVTENVETSVGASQQEVAGQLTTASALDAKLMGILGFMGAAAGVMLTVTNGLASNRWILLLGAGGAIVIALVGLIGPDDLKSGPNPIDFYNEFGGVAPDEFAEQLLADLGKTIKVNTELIDERRASLSGAFSWAVLGAAAFGLVRLLT